MSEMINTVTKLKDKKALIEALVCMGFDVKHIEDNATAVPLYGYQGDFRTADGRGHTTDPAKAMKGNIVIRRKHVGGASNDLGFLKNPDGTYTFTSSAYDRHATIGVAKETGGYNDKWVKRLEGNYNEKLVTRKIREKGMNVRRTERVVNGQKLVTLVGYK